MDDNKLLKFALRAGEVMLANGAETHRVQDTMKRILSTSHSNGVEALAMSTFLIVSIPSKKLGSLTLTRAVLDKTTDFEKICGVNDISRAFVSKQITLDEAREQLKKVEEIPSYPAWLMSLASAIACLALTIMLDGSFLDGITAFISGIISGIFLRNTSKFKVPYFFSCLVLGFIAGTNSCIFHNFLPITEIKMVIIGSIMPFLPGMTITNGIRDIIEGNFISGTSKMVEALLIAVAIAGGVGFSMSMFL